MADNQKLFSQMADLGRNMNLLSESDKKNTSAIQEMSVAGEDGGDKKIGETLESLDKTLKDIQKVLSAKSKETPQPTISPEQKSAQPNQKEPQKEKNDFSKIAGGIAKSVVRAFQEGGVAPKSGDYLVGENGPEIVSLPKGSGVIPLNLKDLMAGIAKVPELSELLKENTKAGVYGNFGSDLIVTEDGKRINLSKLDEIYQRQYDDLEEKEGDPKILQEIGGKMHAIWDLQESAAKVVNDSIDSLNSQRRDILDKSIKDFNDKDLEYVESARKDIINKSDPSDLNTYTLAKAHLMATQMLLEKKSKEASTKDEFDKLGKMEDKSKEVINPKVESAKKEAEKSKGEEKSGGLLSKMGLKKKEPQEKEESKDETSDKKASAVLSKAGKFAENVAFGVASKVIGANLPGVGGALAQKGLGSLKKLVDKEKSPADQKGGGEKGTPGQNQSEMKEAKPSLTKLEAGANKEETTGTPVLKNEVKKLTPSVKPAETKKEPEPTKEVKQVQPEISKNSEPQTPKADQKKTSAESSSTGSQSPLGTSKDIDDIKSALSRIASILEGPLTVSPIDPPFRPDSRRL